MYPTRQSRQTTAYVLRRGDCIHMSSFLWSSFWANTAIPWSFTGGNNFWNSDSGAIPQQLCSLWCYSDWEYMTKTASFYRAPSLSREPEPTPSVSEFADKGGSLQYRLTAYRLMYSTVLWHNKRDKPLLGSCKDTWRQIFTAPRLGWTLRMWSVKLWLKPSSDFRSKTPWVSWDVRERADKDKNRGVGGDASKSCAEFSFHMIPRLVPPSPVQVSRLKEAEE